MTDQAPSDRHKAAAREIHDDVYVRMELEPLKFDELSESANDMIEHWAAILQRHFPAPQRGDRELAAKILEVTFLVPKPDPIDRIAAILAEHDRELREAAEQPIQCPMCNGLLGWHFDRSKCTFAVSALQQPEEGTK